MAEVKWLWWWLFWFAVMILVWGLIGMPMGVMR